MAQSATQRGTPLAKENIALANLLEPKPENVQLPIEPIYENTLTGFSAQSQQEENL